MTSGIVLSLNVGGSAATPVRGPGVTGIGKRPVDHPVTVRRPGPKTTGLHSGIVGDFIGDTKHHGGDDQAVYAYAIEDYAWWSAELGRELKPALFGENLTTQGLNLYDAVLGERWRVGDEVVLETTFGRVPCATFQHRMGEPGWIKRFAAANRTGAYLRIVREGSVATGDRIEVIDRPAHGLTLSEAFNIYMHAPENLARLLIADALPLSTRTKIEQRLSTAPR
ncbi:MOSC domain-containing protein [Actinoplanes derwentensis]|uniref:MOSC domain-containing protein YiiM n=1 Tax=Actinoplanes derwentensis TaxID=113562 RepID=A0A1H2CLS6_9ACTN|nr:MOSC domain-containing protein [Actinoplanes derwentensis]GID86131.1 molybdenum cofactor biosysynthesis protein [Actinoplanes derwentensis]SDT71460.1 MOSC domain-containing protein YiiM [Actinoplanes derwentensis]